MCRSVSAAMSMGRRRACRAESDCVKGVGCLGSVRACGVARGLWVLRGTRPGGAESVLGMSRRSVGVAGQACSREGGIAGCAYMWVSE